MLTLLRGSFALRKQIKIRMRIRWFSPGPAHFPGGLEQKSLRHRGLQLDFHYRFLPCKKQLFFGMGWFFSLLTGALGGPLFFFVSSDISLANAEKQPPRQVPGRLHVSDGFCVREKRPAAYSSSSSSASASYMARRGADWLRGAGPPWSAPRAERNFARERLTSS